MLLLLSFAAFLPFDELGNLRRSDVKMDNDMLQSDQHRDGVWVVVASSGKTTCPVSVLSIYFNMAKLNSKPRSQGLSYTWLRHLVLEAFKGIVPDIQFLPLKGQP